MVKEFEQDPQSNVWIFLDGDKNYHYYNEGNENKNSLQFPQHTNKSKLTLPEDSFEYCVSAAASIASYYLENDKSLGFCSNSQNIILLSPEKGERQLSKVMEVLALVQADSISSLEELLENQSSQIKKGSTIVIISSTTSENVLFSIDKIKKRGVTPIFVSVDVNTFGSSENNSDLVSKMQNNNIRTISIANKQNLLQSIVNSSKY